MVCTTLRRRKPDSNHRSRVTTPKFSTPAHVTCLTPCTRKSRREPNSVLQARVREAQYRELDARRRAGLVRGLAYLHLKKDLEAEPG